MASGDPPPDMSKMLLFFQQRYPDALRAFQESETADSPRSPSPSPRKSKKNASAKASKFVTLPRSRSRSPLPEVGSASYEETGLNSRPSSVMSTQSTPALAADEAAQNSSSESDGFQTVGRKKKRSAKRPIKNSRHKVDKLQGPNAKG
ncbi:unnamed protein product [Pieris brassicae]|uniref:Uncharacterized protein n=1 Tax=Pieris brassicae TaxID=7116 RepID=A0A9P0TLW0_PIEBR|nr:unnamed protein product [Pieris brassicae]